MNKTLLIGDLIFDNHYLIKKIGTSLETNTPKFQILKNVTNLGGAGFVYTVLRNLSKNIIFLTKNNDIQYLNLDKNIVTINCNENNIIKNRYWSKNKKVYQLNEDNFKITKQSNKILLKLKSILIKEKKINKIIISDYNHGVISQEIIDFICSYSKKNKILLFVDAQVRLLKEIKNYSNVDYFFMNENEKKLYLKKFRQKDICGFIKKNKIRNIVLKRGKRGVSIIGKHKIDVKGLKGKKVVDEAGAGDTLLAIFSQNIEKNNLKMILNKSNREAYKMITKEKKYVW